ncbi:isochorismatase family protein [Gordonia neofelifaecis]|uniref:N-carbamoylsarcosine amidase n=1 Tax=Gordonia neofelifaecis NRRL B-59395 TaxID=644548 RepID=F1YHS1_9ACTN|nr:isochorismatase family protein [Gordonia neofelifaecis]EGD55909.1 N-carbamoylsarcosine amidase [Gordonia neofelifaecis NRRL B-59395]
MTDADGVRERYAKGGLLGRLTPGTAPALVVVDLQYGFTEPRYAPGFDLDHVVNATADLLAAARANDVPVLYTTIAFPDDDGTGGTWLQKMPALEGLRLGDRSVEIDARVAPADGDAVLVKQAASAFAGTGLAELLSASSVDSILVVGATTSGCVRATAVDGCTADLPVFVVREAVGDREQAPHDAALLDLDAKYADVIGLGEALTLLQARPVAPTAAH